MANETKEVKKEADPKEVLTLQLTREDIFQLHLCVVCRHSVASLKLVNALNEQETKGATGLTNYLQHLDQSLFKALGVNLDESK